MSSNQIDEILRLQHIRDEIKLHFAKMATEVNEIHLIQEMEKTIQSYNPGACVAHKMSLEADPTSTSKLGSVDMEYCKGIDLRMDQMDEVVKELLKLKLNTFKEN